MRITRIAFVFFLTFSLVVRGAELSCPAKVSEVSRFEEMWAKDFSRFPSPAAVEPWLKDRLLANQQLNPKLRALLEQGQSPLALDPGVLGALGSAFRTLIQKSSLTEQRKRELNVALDDALGALHRQIPEAGQPPVDDSIGGSGSGGGGDGAGGEPPAFDNLPEDIQRYVKQKGFQRCVIRTAILFVVSNVINTAGALQAKWEKYAGGKGALDGLFDQTTWDAAMADKDFRHNITWNAILMLSLGVFSCLDKNVGKNLMTALSAATSVAGQYLSTGEVSIRQTLLDALFVRWISVNKSNFAFRLAESYSRRGLPAKHLAEVLIQSTSEGLGAYLYPRANDWSKWLFKN